MKYVLVFIIASVLTYVSCSSAPYEILQIKHSPELSGDKTVFLFMSNKKTSSYNEKVDSYLLAVAYINKSEYYDKIYTTSFNIAGVDVDKFSAKSSGSISYKGKKYSYDSKQLPVDNDLFEMVRKNGGNAVIINSMSEYYCFHPS